jgi:hypothetical protein
MAKNIKISRLNFVNYLVVRFLFALVGLRKNNNIQKM